jgi:predicted methyltransferase
MIFMQRHDLPAHLPAILAAACLAVAFGGCTTPPAQGPSASERARKAIASPIRTDQDRRMDASRDPAEFLPFIGVKPGMMVLDVSAGGGYTSQLLALSVAPDGKVWAQREQPGAALTKRLADNPQADLIPVYRPFEDPAPPDAPKLDLITIVNNYHDISYLPVDRAKMDAHLFAALKPGGHLAVVDHSAQPGTGITAGKTLHRIDQAVVLSELKGAGFVLEAEGQFLRNPADTRDFSSGDGRMPTDKFVLLFVKP